MKKMSRDEFGRVVGEMSSSKEGEEDISEADMRDKKQEAITSKDDEIETLSKENEDEM